AYRICGPMICGERSPAWLLMKDIPTPQSPPFWDTPREVSQRAITSADLTLLWWPAPTGPHCGYSSLLAELRRKFSSCQSQMYLTGQSKVLRARLAQGFGRKLALCPRAGI